MSLDFLDETPEDFPDEENGIPVFSVTQLTHGVRDLLGTVFPDVRVFGEVTDMTVARTGHTYFSLKDENAQLSAVIWRSARNVRPGRERMSDEIRNGLEVICRGRLEVYPPRGTYQLIVTEVEARGRGALERAFLELKKRLAAEGLFEREHKKPIPAWIGRVGVVTSLEGAAIRDFLEVLRRRWQGVDVMIFPSPVQGDGAAERLAEGVRAFNRLSPEHAPDCLVVTRGGGSMEDLWEFNEEVLVRAIFESRIPVISAVGHEIDVTLCDLVADVRALTPSEAAERISPDISALRDRLKQDTRRLRFAMQNLLETRKNRLAALSAHPAFKFPYRMIQQTAQKLDTFSQSLDASLTRCLDRLETGLRHAAENLETLSPLRVLSRGYSVTKDIRTGKSVRSAAELLPGSRIVTRLEHGEVVSVVEEMTF